jgi:hypothetical protein
LPVATASVLGGIKQGSGVTVAGDGTLNLASYSTTSATLDATNKIGNGVLSNGNLTLTYGASGTTAAYSTAGSTGSFYFEFTNNNTGYRGVGLTTNTGVLQASLFFLDSTGSVYDGSNVKQGNAGTGLPGTVGIAWNATTHVATVYSGGSTYNFTLTAPTGPVYAQMYLSAGSGGGGAITVNFGATAFANTQPNGYATLASTVNNAVSSFNTRVGAITLTSSDVTTALTYTPVAPGANSNITSLTGLTTALSVAQGGTGTTTSTGTGSVVLSVSPALTGTPTAPTASTADSSTVIATTAFVKAQGYATTAGSVTSVAGRTGAVVLSYTDVSQAAKSGTNTDINFLNNVQNVQPINGSGGANGNNLVVTSSSAGGNASGVAYNGGVLSLLSGTGANSTGTGGGFGGAINITAGNSASGTSGGGGGGAVNIKGGNTPVDFSTTGGDVTITAGSAGTSAGGSTGTGGSVVISGGVLGAAGVSGAGGPIIFKTAASGVTATERLRFLANGAWSVGTGGAATGTAGQALVSNGATTPPTWQTVASAGANTTITSLTGLGYGTVTVPSIAFSGDTTTGIYGASGTFSITAGGVQKAVFNTAGSTFTGVVTIPTAAASDNSTTAASTAFVKSLFGANNGIASLDGTGKLTTSQIPLVLVGAMQYQGTFNPATNTPALASGVGTKGQFYKVSTAATNVTSTIQPSSTVNAGAGTNVTNVQLNTLYAAVAVGMQINFNNGQTATITALNSPSAGYLTFTPALTFTSANTATITSTVPLDGISQFNVGDIVAFNGTTWDKIDGISSEVVSVAGRTGAVTLTPADISGVAPLASPAFTGVPTAPTPATSDNSTTIATTAFVKAAAASTSFASQVFTATAGQTSFTIAGGYTAGLIEVYGNGYKLNSTDYTAANGTTVVLNVGLVAGDELEVVVFGALSVSTITNGGTINGTLSLQSVYEKVNIVATAPAATQNIDLSTAGIWNFTVAATANFTMNVRGSASASLDSTMAVGQAATVAVLVLNGATAYYPTAYTIDGTAVTPKWNGPAPAAGDASAIDSYSLTIIKTAAATFTVLAAVTKFA